MVYFGNIYEPAKYRITQSVTIPALIYAYFVRLFKKTSPKYSTGFLNGGKRALFSVQLEQNVYI